MKFRELPPKPGTRILVSESGNEDSVWKEAIVDHFYKSRCYAFEKNSYTSDFVKHWPYWKLVSIQEVDTNRMDNLEAKFNTLERNANALSSALEELQYKHDSLDQRFAEYRKNKPRKRKYK